MPPPINCLAVIARDESILYKGSFAECYNYMVNYPTKWSNILYALRRSTSITLYGPAPIKLAELRRQYTLNLHNKK